MDPSIKKSRGQFYTTNSDYILEGLPLPPDDIRCISEPFAGKGDLIKWILKKKAYLPIEGFDIEPKHPLVRQKDTLKTPPSYDNTWILTNPPYLARNKSENKDIYDLYNTNDLYKCFLHSVSTQNNCRGGIFIIPAGFFFSPRDLDVRCRNEFLTRFKITRVKYFEEQVFPDTPTTVVAFSFEKSPKPLTEQEIEWIQRPSGQTRIFSLSAKNNWIVGGEIYNLPVPQDIYIRRHVEGQSLKQGEQQTFMTLNALDSGSQDGRICLTYKKGYVYPAEECARSFATLRVQGRFLTETEQITICKEFNEFIEMKRSETWSLFLPQYRESKEYARKRIPFELAYRIVLHLIRRLAQ